MFAALVAVMVMFVPVGILIMVFPTTVPAVVVITAEAGTTLNSTSYVRISAAHVVDTNVITGTASTVTTTSAVASGQGATPATV